MEQFCSDVACNVSFDPGRDDNGGEWNDSLSIEAPSRKHPPVRLDYRNAGWYFVTIWVRRGAHMFGEVADGETRFSFAGRIADSELRDLPRHYENVKLDSFVVMPNHVHAIVVIDGQHSYSPQIGAPVKVRSNSVALVSPKAGSLSTIVRSYKSGVTRRCHDAGFRAFAWQSRFYEHMVRNTESLEKIRAYIENNPANWLIDQENLRIQFRCSLPSPDA